MAGRRYSDDEMVNLHVLLRFYCGSFGISFKEFCSDLSKEIGGDAEEQAAYWVKENMKKLIIVGLLIMMSSFLFAQKSVPSVRLKKFNGAS